MKSKHQLRSEKTYQAFIDAIMEQIMQGDLEHFTIRSLCSRLGLSPRTFYLYFENKEHAILQCYQRHENALLKEILQSLSNIQDPMEKVLQIFDTKIKVSLQMISLGRELYVCALHYYDPYLFSEEIPLYKYVKQALEECLEKKVCTFDMDVPDLTWELIDFSRGIVFDYYLRQESYDLRKISSQRMRRYFLSFCNINKQ